MKAEPSTTTVPPFPASIRTLELLKATLDSSLDMIQVFQAVRNDQGHIVDFKWALNNHASENIYGDVIGKSLLDHNPGVVEEGIFDTFKKVVETGIPDQSERHYVHEQFNGWFCQSIVKLNDGVVTTTQDITARKKAEQKITEALKEKEKADFVLNAINTACYELDFDGTIIYINEKAKELFHLSDEQLLGKNIWEVFPDVKQPGCFLAIQQQALNAKTYAQHEYISAVLNKWISLSATPTDNGCIVLFTEIDEFKKAEQEVSHLKDEIAKRATDKYYSLFNSMDEGFCIIELMYNEKGEIADLVFRESNPSFDKHTGLGMVVGKTVRELLPNFEQRWINIIDQVAKTGESIRHENYIQDVDRWYSTHFFRMGGAGSCFVAVAFNDITERKRREAQMVLLNEVNENLLQVDSIDDTMNTLCEILGVHFDAAVCAFSEVDETEGIVNVRFVWHLPGVPSPSGIYRISDYHSDEIRQLMRSSSPEIVQDTSVFPQTVATRMQELGIGAFVNLPFVRNGQWRATLSITNSKPRIWREDEIELMRELTFRIWTRMERIRTEKSLRVHEQRMRYQKEAFQAVVNGASLMESLNMIVLLVTEETNGEARTAFYIADADGTCLHPVWGAGNMPYAYLKEIDGFRIGVDSLACGLTVPTGQPVLTSDVLEEPLWKPWTHLAQKYDYRGCWSFPIKSRENKAVGTFAMYFRNPREATTQDLALADIVTHTAAVIISNAQEVKQRALAEEALRNSEEELRTLNASLESLVLERTEELRAEHHFLEQVTDKTPLLVFVFDLLEQRFNYINKRVEELIGKDQEYVIAMGPHLFQAILYPGDLANRTDYMSQLSTLKENEIRSHEFRIWVSNNFQWFRSRESIFFQESGTVRQVIGIAENINFEKLLEEKVLRENGKLGLN